MKKKIFVLDTSVLGANGDAIFTFQEHDIIIPVYVLEELDGLKKGDGRDVHYQARQAIRNIDKICQNDGVLESWNLIREGLGSLQIFFSAKHTEKRGAVHTFDEKTMDNLILDTAIRAKQIYSDHQIVLVSKDVNLRLKAKSLGILVEDYQHDKISPDSINSNITIVDDFDQSIIDRLYTNRCISDDLPDEVLIPNRYFILKGTNSEALAHYSACRQSLEVVHKHTTYGIKPRNAEQAFAMHAILDPDIKLVALHGVAGTGKTLISLAASLEQRKSFNQIYLARPIVPLSNKDLGYLPGDIKSKIDPYMQPLYDNIKFIKGNIAENDKKILEKMESEEKLLVSPLAYIRGRSLSNIIFIVDEAQNLTPHEVKTIVTRAGENAKFIFTGDIKQIDTPYLDELSNGLSHMVAKVSGQKLFTHVKLSKGERSELANLGNEFL